MSFATAPPPGLPCVASRPAVRRGSRQVHSTLAVSHSQKHSAAHDASKSGSASVKQALVALSTSVPAVFWATAARAADNAAATEALRPLDYVILAVPTLAYGLFYLQREQRDVRVRVARGCAAALEGCDGVGLTVCFLPCPTAAGVQKVAAGDAGGEDPYRSSRSPAAGEEGAAASGAASGSGLHRPRDAYQVWPRRVQHCERRRGGPAARRAVFAER
jgi:hypothetical protein